jgi:hypothetical protein
LIHKNLLNNFNIPKALAEIDEIIKAVNVYLKEKPYINTLLLAISNYIRFIFYSIGISYDNVTKLYIYICVFLIFFN